ncbi:hypothetical protein [Pajaroellobacter abortibovis]|uniref:Uncharacterized protein n=1 Tax=Pajaroellobacter abortibovis TaxID=1882918 RepID=A0A1L6MWU4_9BACT|nr:hypothetical protein [Pajaroellobacter abortibovis]APS00013.1 hypothetical protein BCY86_04420 [Pajaroellobacter abortibovis]
MLTGTQPLQNLSSPPEGGLVGTVQHSFPIYEIEKLIKGSLLEKKCAPVSEEQLHYHIVVYYSQSQQKKALTLKEVAKKQD